MEKTVELKIFEQFGLSDIGSLRQKNEDNFGYAETINGHIFIVCDGIGGNPAGEIASKIAVNEIIRYFTTDWHKNPVSALRKSFELANDNILKYGNENTQNFGLGTTAVAVLIRDNKFYFSHIGDSRIYFSGGSKIFQLTEDHSFVQQLVNKNIITAEQAKQHPRANEITQALGISEKIKPQISLRPFYPTNDSFLVLCTDGLSSYIDQNTFADILFSENSLKEKASNFIQSAIEKGSDDNITVQIIRFFNTGNLNDISLNFENLKHNSSKVTLKRKISFTGLVLLFFVLIFFTFRFLYQEWQSSEKPLNGNSNQVQMSKVPVFCYTKCTKDTFINLKINNYKDYENAINRFSAAPNKVQAVENFHKFKKNTYLKFSICDEKQLILGNEIFAILHVESLKYEDILKASGKSTLYFIPGERIILPLSSPKTVEL